MCQILGQIPPRRANMQNQYNIPLRPHIVFQIAIISVFMLFSLIFSVKFVVFQSFQTVAKQMHNFRHDRPPNVDS